MSFSCSGFEAKFDVLQGILCAASEPNKERISYDVAVPWGVPKPEQKFPCVQYAQGG